MKRFDALERSHADQVKMNVALASDVSRLPYSERDKTHHTGEGVDVHSEGAQGHPGRRAEDAQEYGGEDAR